jgi:2-polyprenyl-6-methoxyphenol hydroxylase-like FAD-dependent oxidoreductase
MTRNTKEVLIVGSGFAGLILAITLKKKHIPFKLFEANYTTLHIGGSITLFPNSMKVLRLTGIADKVINSGVIMEVAKFQDNFGKHLVNRSMGKSSIYGEPTITLRRSKLNNIILKRAEELGIEICYGKKVVGLIESENGIQLNFEDGTFYVGSTVLGCDGINSFVRKSVLKKNILPNYTKLLYLGGFVDNQGLISKLNLDANTQYISIGPTHFFAYSFIDNPTKGDASLLWYCYLSQPNRLSKVELNSLENKKVIERVLSVHRGWHYPIKEMIENTVEVCKSSISDIVEIDNWYKGRILVLGDAAHAMNPLSGQGAGTAMEDGYLIANLIIKYNNDYETAFKNFVKLRKKRTTLIARNARKSSKRTTIQLNKYIVMLRNRAFALLTYLTPEKVLNKPFLYDVNEELNKIK